MKYDEPRFKKGIPTLYKGINFRSRLEARCARLLDEMKLKREYESKAFVLENGKELWPDFFLPELNTWVETKGMITESDIEDFIDFSEEFGYEEVGAETGVVLLSNDEAVFLHGNFVFNDGTGAPDLEKLSLGKCSECGSYFFAGEEGSYHCRKCKAHNGCHDMVKREVGGLKDLINIIRGN